MSQKALRVSIFRPADMGDCTNDGVTGLKRNAQDVFLLGVPDGNYDQAELVERLKSGESIVVLQLVRRRFGAETYVHAVPFLEGRPTAAGGNFVYTSDSRFRAAVCPYPISVHDHVINYDTSGHG